MSTDLPSKVLYTTDDVAAKEAISGLIDGYGKKAIELRWKYHQETRGGTRSAGLGSCTSHEAMFNAEAYLLFKYLSGDIDEFPVPSEILDKVIVSGNDVRIFFLTTVRSFFEGNWDEIIRTRAEANAGTSDLYRQHLGLAVEPYSTLKTIISKQDFEAKQTKIVSKLISFHLDDLVELYAALKPFEIKADSLSNQHQHHPSASPA